MTNSYLANPTTSIVLCHCVHIYKIDMNVSGMKECIATYWFFVMSYGKPYNKKITNGNTGLMAHL